VGEVEELEGMLKGIDRALKELDYEAAGWVRASAEKRQILKALGEARAAEALVAADRDLARSRDPAKIAAVLLRELPNIARADPVLGVQIRDALIQALPLEV